MLAGSNHFLLTVIFLLIWALRTEAFVVHVAGSGSETSRETGQHSTSRNEFVLQVVASRADNEFVKEQDALKLLVADLEQKEVEGLESLEVRRNKSSLRGLYTTEDWNAGDYICGFPFSASIVVDEVIEEQTPDSLQENHQDGSIDDAEELEISREDVKHGLQFLQEIVLDEDSGQGSYVECLPKLGTSNFDATPDFWPLEDLNSIPVPRLRHAATNRKARIKETVDGMTQQGARDITINNLQWATWIVRTRGFTTLHVLSSSNCSSSSSDQSSQTKRIRKRKVLLPFIDFMNHHPEANCVMEVLEDGDANDDEASMYALRASRDIQAGEEVNIVYGTGFENSLDRLDKYGFWIEENFEADVDEFSVNDGLDWSLVDEEWKKEVESSSSFTKGPLPDVGDEPISSKARHFRTHLRKLYQRVLRMQRRIGFDV